MDIIKEKWYTEKKDSNNNLPKNWQTVKKQNQGTVLAKTENFKKFK